MFRGKEKFDGRVHDENECERWPVQSSDQCDWNIVHQKTGTAVEPNQSKFGLIRKQHVCPSEKPNSPCTTPATKPCRNHKTSQNEHAGKFRGNVGPPGLKKGDPRSWNSREAETSEKSFDEIMRWEKVLARGRRVWPIEESAKLNAGTTWGSAAEGEGEAQDAPGLHEGQIRAAALGARPEVGPLLQRAHQQAETKWGGYGEAT